MGGGGCNTPRAADGRICGGATMQRQKYGTIDVYDTKPSLPHAELLKSRSSHIHGQKPKPKLEPKDTSRRPPGIKAKDEDTPPPKTKG